MNTLIIVNTPTIPTETFYFNNVHAAADFCNCGITDLVYAAETKSKSGTQVNGFGVTILEDEHVMFSLDPDLV